MAGKRESYTDNEHSILYAETKGICPLCTQPILFRKQGATKPDKGYEIAHIYPLNPNAIQKFALIGYPAPAAINSLENVIALCPSCHSKYDKNFKIEEYVKLKGMKAEFLSNSRAKLTLHRHAIQEEVCEILGAITGFDLDIIEPALTSYNVYTVDSKLKNGMSSLQKREIKLNATTFYVRIRDHIRLLEKKDQVAVRILQNQINTYYLAMQQQNPNDKDAVFNYIADWISVRADKSILASKILASFFVQNCEIFDVNSD